MTELAKKSVIFPKIIGIEVIMKNDSFGDQTCQTSDGGLFIKKTISGLNARNTDTVVRTIVRMNAFSPVRYLCRSRRAYN